MTNTFNAGLVKTTFDGLTAKIKLKYVYVLTLGKLYAEAVCSYSENSIGNNFIFYDIK